MTRWMPAKGWHFLYRLVLRVFRPANPLGIRLRIWILQSHRRAQDSRER